MKSLNIMVVDDSTITTCKIQTALEEAGHSVVCTQGKGKDAVEAYPLYLPDVITMDIAMPDMSGIEATRAIISKYPNALVVMVTTQGNEQMVIDAVDAGAKGYVLKPIKPEMLCETVERVFARYGVVNND